MATVFAVYNNNGCVGRCDAKCHNAKGEECRCICGGVMHGVGARIAMEDRSYITDAEIIENACQLGTDGPLRVARAAEQYELFP